MLAAITLPRLASAGIILDGSLTLQIGQLPSISVPVTPGSVSVVDNGPLHDIVITANAWDFAGAAASTTLLTGYALLNQLHLTANVPAGTLTAYFPSTPNPVGGAAVPAITPSSGTLCPAS